MSGTVASSVTKESVLFVNDQGVIKLRNTRMPLTFARVQDGEITSANQEFPDWPCNSGPEYKASFENFIDITGLPFNDYDLSNMQNRINDKIFALKRSPWVKLLNGPCLPLICPKTESANLKEIFFWHYWQAIRESNFCQRANLLNGLVNEKPPLGPGYWQSTKLFTVRLVFPQAFPPLNRRELFDYSEAFKTQYFLDLAEPWEIFCAMLTYPKIFQGYFRFFFPDFPLSNMADGRKIHAGKNGNPNSLIAMLAGDRRIMSFQTIGEIDPEVFDFCPVIF